MRRRPTRDKLRPAAACVRAYVCGCGCRPSTTAPPAPRSELERRWPRPRPVEMYTHSPDSSVRASAVCIARFAFWACGTGGGGYDRRPQMFKCLPVCRSPSSSSSSFCLFHCRGQKCVPNQPANGHTDHRTICSCSPILASHTRARSLLLAH